MGCKLLPMRRKSCVIEGWRFCSPRKAPNIHESFRNARNNGHNGRRCTRIQCTSARDGRRKTSRITQSIEYTETPVIIGPPYYIRDHTEYMTE